MKDVEARDKVISNILPFIAIGFVVFSIYVFCIPISSPGSNFFYGTITGISGLVALLVSLFKFVFDSSKQAYVAPLEKCLVWLEQAQALQDKIKKSEEGNTK